MRLGSRGTRAAVASAVVALSACSAPRVVARVPLAATSAEWRQVRDRLATLREASPTRPYVEELAVALHEPRSGRTFEARGALAIDPRRALRLILVGPGGATALDVWMTDSRFRFVVPALSLHRTGGTDAESARGLPIAFFRWWMMHPLDGHLRAGGERSGESLFVLGEDEATVLLHTRDGGRSHEVFATRRGSGHDEEVTWNGLTPTAAGLGHARYVDRLSGLRVEVDVQRLSEDPPDPAAFADPDGPGGEQGS